MNLKTDDQKQKFLWAHKKNSANSPNSGLQCQIDGFIRFEVVTCEQMTKLDERKKIEVIDQKYKLSRVITFDDICKCRQQAQFALEREQVDSFEIQSSTKRAAKKRLQEFPET